jgi:hypothetical protein
MVVLPRPAGSCLAARNVCARRHAAPGRLDLSAFATPDPPGRPRHVVRATGAGLRTMFDAVGNGWNLKAGIVTQARLAKSRPVRLRKPPLGSCRHRRPKRSAPGSSRSRRSTSWSRRHSGSRTWVIPVDSTVARAHQHAAEHASSTGAEWNQSCSLGRRPGLIPGLMEQWTGADDRSIRLTPGSGRRLPAAVSFDRVSAFPAQGTADRPRLGVRPAAPAASLPTRPLRDSVSSRSINTSTSCCGDDPRPSSACSDARCWRSRRPRHRSRTWASVDASSSRP